MQLVQYGRNAMFWTGDTFDERHARITAFVNEDEIVVAVLLAAANFEWTVRRCIIAMSKRPNVEIRNTLKDERGFGLLPKYWQSEIAEAYGQKISEVVPSWDFLQKDAFGLRNALIHGDQNTVGLDYGKQRVDVMLEGAAAVVRFARAHGVDLYGSRIPVIQKARQQNAA